ncbi:response regulator [Haloferula sp.]|uniref:response regulator n=1 Tax=Haloferula sp. TaxID=2497595 RepID=UPI003C75702A
MSHAKILIADDGRVMRTVITAKLAEKDYSVTAVASGREALESIEQEPVDLVVLDIHMPDMDGLETLRHLRQRYTAIQLPVIMATANDEDEDVIESFEAGANDFVSKPINFPILFARMETHLKLKRAMEKLERLADD